MNSLNNSPQLDLLIHGALEGDLSADDQKILEDNLRADPAARRRYLELAELHSLLSEESEPYAPGANPVIPIGNILSRQKLKVVKIAAVAAVIIFSLVGIFLNHFKQADLPEISNIRTSPGTIYSTSPPANPTEEAVAEPLPVGGKLTLVQGTLELKLPSGVISLIQAPAEVFLQAPDHLELLEGRADFQVPPEASGFTVSTEDILVKDIGTHFGVIADRGPRRVPDQVHVLEGLVEVSTKRSPSSPIELTEGNSLEFGPEAKLSPSAFSPELFPTSLPDALPFLHWSFDTPSPLKVEGLPELANSVTTRIDGGDLSIRQAKVGTAYRFSKGGAYLRTNWEGTQADRPRTVSCWIKCPMHQPIGSIVKWGIPQKNSAKWRVVLNPDTQNENGQRGALRTEFGFGYVIGTTDLRDGKWHHIASVYDGSGYGSPDSIKLYVDGNPEAISAFKSNRINTITQDSDAVPLLIGKNFVGTIDELRIDSGVLPHSEIRKLHNKAREKNQSKAFSP